MNRSEILTLTDALGITQADIAKRAGKTRQAISRRKWSPAIFKAAEDLLTVARGDFITLTNAAATRDALNRFLGGT